MEKAALTLISSSLIAHKSLIKIFLSRYPAQFQMCGTWGPVDTGVPVWCLPPEILPVVEPAELWEQRSAASAPLWERSLLLGPKPSERRRYSDNHLLSVCNPGELGILFHTSLESVPPTPEAAVPLLSVPAVLILPMSPAPDTSPNSVPRTWAKLDAHFLTQIIF